MTHITERFMKRSPEGGIYRQSLGQLELVSLGIGGTIGSGIFVVPGIAAGIMGPASLIAWVIVALSATLVMLSLSWVSSSFGRKGTFFTIFSSTFGVKMSTAIVLLYTASAIFGVATIAAGIGQYLSYFGIGNLLVIEILIIAVFCIVNLIGISLSGLTENILTLLKILPLVIITLVLLPFVRPEYLAPTVPFTVMGLFSTIIIVYWPFTGFEISALPVDEMRDPRLVARSLGIVMVTVAAIYLLLNLALIGSVGSDVLVASPAPIATAVSLVFSGSGYLVAVIGIFAMLSAMNAYIIASSRVVHNLATEHRVTGLSRLTSTGTPGIALLVCCGLTAAMLFFSNQFSTLATLSVITILLPYIFFCIAAFLLFSETRRKLVSGMGALMTTAILILFFVYR
jgi:amino acid transporter